MPVFHPETGCRQLRSACIELRRCYKSCRGCRSDVLRFSAL